MPAKLGSKKWWAQEQGDRLDQFDERLSRCELRLNSIGKLHTEPEGAKTCKERRVEDLVHVHSAIVDWLAWRMGQADWKGREHLPDEEMRLCDLVGERWRGPDGELCCCTPGVPEDGCGLHDSATVRLEEKLRSGGWKPPADTPLTCGSGMGLTACTLPLGHRGMHEGPHCGRGPTARWHNPEGGA